ncbi:phytol kinase [Acholeplasma morum]|uniref:diacylglycerol/polyprenol kinase family protein n=1 Tax=Paracholeplasma morum TaxID=264637 RepID=UPI00195697ED|nr:hypothetical protein [Paracholeplasma morum]MBM7452966.1 phytol kinase [Paracholeplasma morum]
MNLLGLGLSYVLVFLVIGLSTLLQKKGLLADEGARKFIHIGVSNWWILAMFTFDLWYIAVIAPITFVLLNYYSYKTNLIKSMERSGKGNLGTVYFPISLVILVLIGFGLKSDLARFDIPILVLVGAVGILTLGYGDGLAAVIGKKYGKYKIVNDKSILGSLSMLVVTFVVVTFISLIHLNLPMSLLVGLTIAVIATAVELFTPKGLDNLTVPLVSSLMYYLLLLF